MTKQAGRVPQHDFGIEFLRSVLYFPAGLSSISWRALPLFPGGPPGGPLGGRVGPSGVGRAPRGSGGPLGGSGGPLGGSGGPLGGRAGPLGGRAGPSGVLLVRVAFAGICVGYCWISLNL